tara:strand:+ start:242 stop:835 length:594 start_codon:yes stop_codon:yes gene_type:complete
MRIFISVLILIFSFQSWTKADDITDFEIEGISIGDSALDYVNKNFINKEKYYYPASKKFAEFNIDKWNHKSFNFEIYDGVHITFKDNDSKYIVTSLRGKIYYFENNINECYEIKKKIVSDLEEMFVIKRRNDDEGSHEADASEKSMTTSTFLYFVNGGRAAVQCYDWSEEMKKYDNLSVSISTEEYSYWLDYEAFDN